MPKTTRFVVLIAAVLLTLPLTAEASAPPPETSTHVYTKNLEPLGAAPRASAGINSDLAFWGNTAYQGSYYGFSIVDITNPASPQTIINFEDCKGSQGDVIIWENLLVRSWGSPAPANSTCDGDPVAQGFEGLHLFDVSNPLDPDLIASVETECGSHTATGVPDIANNRLYVYNSPSDGSCPGFDIVDIPLDTPTAAKQIGVGETGRACHDTSVILGTELRAMCAGGNGFSMMSLGGVRGGSLADPVLLYSKDLSSEFVTIGHAASFSWDGDVAIFGHEPGGGTQAFCKQTDDAVEAKTMHFFYTETGTELGEFVLPRAQSASENCTIHNFNVVPTTDKRNVLVAGNYQAGISVVDFTNPASPKEIAYADPAPLSSPAITTGGDWSTHWYDGYIYESDITRGLITWRLTDPAVANVRTLGHLNPQTQEFGVPSIGSLGKCKGKAVTIPGGPANDFLKGTKKADVILGGDGNDVLSGKKGNDRVCGGKGNDILKGGGGNDVLLGQAGKDTGKGGGGKDTFKGGGGKDKGSGFEKGKA